MTRRRSLADDHSVPLVLEPRELELDALGDRQRTFRLTLFYDPALESPDFDQLQRILDAWYMLGFFGAFGDHFNAFGELARRREQRLEIISFTVWGGLSSDAVASLCTVLGCPDHDCGPERMVVALADPEG